MYSVEDREAASAHVVRVARDDPRIVAGAVVGSLALGSGDRWSDLDLTFAVRDDVLLGEVLEDWTHRFANDLDALMLFDLPSGETIYRVFFLPGGLQLDVSFTPASAFAPGGPRFRLLFGETHTAQPSSPTPPQELFGWAVAYAREARACIERGRWWQAEHSINALRDNALAIACLGRGLPARFGRGHDDLPTEVLARFEKARIASLGRADLMEALRVAVDGLLSESGEVGELAAKTGPRLRELLEE